MTSRWRSRCVLHNRDGGNAWRSWSPRSPIVIESSCARQRPTPFVCLRSVRSISLVLARFMKILSPNFVWRYKNKIINIHPLLLPSFPGPQAYRQAYEHGVKIIGVTAHFVSMHLDEGPIIAQDCLYARSNMSLKEIV